VFPSWTGTNCCIDWYGMVHNPTMGCIANLSLHDVADDVVMGSAGWHASRVLCVPRRSHYTNGGVGLMHPYLAMNSPAGSGWLERRG